MRGHPLKSRATIIKPLPPILTTENLIHELVVVYRSLDIYMYLHLLYQDLL